MGDESPELIDECNPCGVCYLACPRTFLPMTSMQQMMSHFEERCMRGIPENIFLELLKKYPQFEFARKKREELGYENLDIV